MEIVLQFFEGLLVLWHFFKLFFCLVLLLVGVEFLVLGVFGGMGWVEFGFCEDLFDFEFLEMRV